MRNISSTDPYVVGAAEPIRTAQQATTNILIVDPNNDPGEIGVTTLYPNITTAALANCVVNVTWTNRNFLEITQAPSEAVYFDYLGSGGRLDHHECVPQLPLLRHGQRARRSPQGRSLPSSLTDYHGTGRTSTAGRFRPA